MSNSPPHRKLTALLGFGKGQAHRVNPWAGGGGGATLRTLSLSTMWPELLLYLLSPSDRGLGGTGESRIGVR